MKIIHGLSPGQVLQRLKNNCAAIKIQGECGQAGPVRFRLILPGKARVKAKARIVGKAAGGKFTATIDKLPAGGPHRFIFEIENESLAIQDIYVGDVWILAGQSNMEGCGSLQNPTSPNSKVRALYMDGNWGLARDPLHCTNDSPDSAHAPINWSARMRARWDKLRATGVGPGISFGTEMVKRSRGVPQGLLCCAHGGTTMKQWDPQGKSLGGATMYGSMIRTLRESGQPVSGVLWYQGESDANQEAAPSYFDNMVRMIRSIRKDLKQPDLAFILVQLSREYNDPEFKTWNHIQIEQARLPKELGRVACVAAIDLPLDDTIHVGSEGHFRLGRRLASEADRLVYGNRQEMPPPEIVSAIRVRKPLRYYRGYFGVDLIFKNVAGNLRSNGPVDGFGLMDPAGEVFNPFYHVEATGNKIRLEAMFNLEDRIKYRVVYGYGKKSLCSLSDRRDMAVGVFGPVPIEDPLALSESYGRWRMTKSQTVFASIQDLKNIPRPKDFKTSSCNRPFFVTPVVTPPSPSSGIIFFFSEINVSETMQGNFRFGYDGPVRFWCDDRELLTDPKGANPLIIDERILPVRLKPGRHRLTVALDFRSGLSWGFLLRFNRTGLNTKQLKSGNYALPECV